MDANECRPRMDANEREFLNELIGKVIGAIYEVANTLGPGFLEKVYERALLIELRLRSVLSAILSLEQDSNSAKVILKPISRMWHIKLFAFIRVYLRPHPSAFIRGQNSFIVLIRG